VKSDRYVTVVSVGPKAAQLGESERRAMLSAGVPRDIAGSGGVCVIEAGEAVFSKQNSHTGTYYDDWFADRLKVSSGKDSPPKIIFNGSNVMKTNEGLSVFVYDTKYERVVDNVGFIAAEGFRPLRSTK
jgi:hypothetical protein